MTIYRLKIDRVLWRVPSIAGFVIGVAVMMLGVAAAFDPTISVVASVFLGTSLCTLSLTWLAVYSAADYRRDLWRALDRHVTVQRHDEWPPTVPVARTARQ